MATWEDTPWFMVECKVSQGAQAKALNYFAEGEFLVTSAESHPDLYKPPTPT